MLASMMLFDPHAFGPGRGHRVIEGRPGELRRIVRWVGRRQWPAQIVLALAAVAVAALALVGGLLVGAGVASWFAFDRHVSVHLPAPRPTRRNVAHASGRRARPWTARHGKARVARLYRDSAGKKKAPARGRASR
jgi:hypothetical protein